MIAFACALLLAGGELKTWYGPATATFQVMFAGNPYDPAVNDVRVSFLGPQGDPIERIAYFDGEGGYKAVLVTPMKGRYKATLMRNGKKLLEQPQEGLLSLDTPLSHGFVRRDKGQANRFVWDDGTPYFPLGCNLGWQSTGYVPMTEEIAKLGKSGANWTRIWASSWDGKNPWWPQTPGTLKDQLWPKALSTWEDLERTCEQNAVEFQMVLFNHGLFSSKVNPNWPDHPWNTKNGGFLAEASNFFTDAEAKRRTKMWLRYAVARYGASPSLLSWELFNEVQWVDARYADRWQDIEAWHKEMAAYIRSIDPYAHLVTTSSEMERPGLFVEMDYYQPHTYPPNVLNAVAGQTFPLDKPGFFGEFGPTGDGIDVERSGLRDGIYGAICANHAGTAMLWDWEKVDKMGLYPEFKVASRVLAASNFAAHPQAKTLSIKMNTAGAGDLRFGPGAGWTNMDVSTFNAPDDLVPRKLSKLPGYFQSMDGNHKDMKAGPITLKLSPKQAGLLKIRFSEISQAGAKISVFVNDNLAKTQDYAPKDKNYAPEGAIEVPYPAGAVTLRIENHGGDWAQIADFVLTNAGPQATGIGVGESDWMLMRLTANAGMQSVSGSVYGLSIGDGDYDCTTIDLDSGVEKTEMRHVANFALTGFTLPGKDIVMMFKRRG